MCISLKFRSCFLKGNLSMVNLAFVFGWIIPGTYCLFLFQLRAQFILNYFHFAVLPLFKSNETPLDSGTFSHHEESWVGSTFSLAAIPGTIFNGFLIPKIGVKRSMLFMCVPTFVSVFFCRFICAS